MKFVRSIFLLTLTAGLIVPNCWAPIEKAPPRDHPLLRSATGAELEHQQSLQRTQGEVGYVPRRDTNAPDAAAEVSDHTAGTNLVAATNAADSAESERAKKVLVQADKAIQQEEGKSSGWLWGLVFGAFGFGSIMGLRTWAAKNIPTGPANMKPATEEFPARKNVW